MKRVASTPRTSWTFIAALLVALLSAGCASQRGGGSTEVLLLSLIRAYPVAGVEGAETSGLTLVDGELFTVSDDHDGTIFRVVLQDTVAMLEPAIHFTAPGDGTTRLDLEGITHDEVGNFYLVSEANFRVLRVDPEGVAEWVTPSFRWSGEVAGLFREAGAYLEGIAKLDADTFMMVAERQPRGLLQIVLSREEPVHEATPLEPSRLRYPRRRNPDLSGLFYESGELWALERAAHAVCRIERDEGEFEVETCWSYAHIENDRRFHYETMEYGRGEGLAMDGERVYVILDNNRQYRAGSTEDRRPLLFVMRRPGGR